VYQPEELATFEAWQRMPRELWRWYLYRRGVCRAANPNPAHLALADLERRLGDALRLVTQNVDGLHARAGHSPERTAAVHGDLDRMREPVTDEVLPLPAEAVIGDRSAPLDDDTWRLLHHPRTGRLCRPHILWFDEFYEERLHRSDTAVRWGRSASAVVVIGTSGAARMPYLVAQAGMAAGAAVVDVNPDDNPFRRLAAGWRRGAWVEADAVEGVARVVSALRLPG
jgi:NAD-dependent deacetylase